jgi:hypothetical protein
MSSLTVAHAMALGRALMVLLAYLAEAVRAKVNTAMTFMNFILMAGVVEMVSLVM